MLSLVLRSPSLPPLLLLLVCFLLLPPLLPPTMPLLLPLLPPLPRLHFGCVLAGEACEKRAWLRAWSVRRVLGACHERARAHKSAAGTC